MSDRDEATAVALTIMTSALTEIANRSDCEYYDDDRAPKPCPCPPCVAKRTLKAAQDWRYMGSHSERLDRADLWPREKAMNDAWRAFMRSAGDSADRRLALILSENPGDTSMSWERPSERDWFVASSIVQWLATNVGMTILEQAGFRYTKKD